jgi:DNA polymerase-3 subunit gamma/tau
LIARYAEGSLRDAESAFDQVISFSGTTVGVDDVATVLGLVGRDLLFDILTAVADEDVAAAFTLAGRAVEAGTDLRILCRELAALVRAMMLVSIDAERLRDPEVVFESDRERLQALTPRFSREDLLRSFDLLAKAEQDVRAASQPRYALEMALVKWIHLRRLVPIADLIAGLEKGGVSMGSAPRDPAALRQPLRPNGPAHRPSARDLRSARGPRHRRRQRRARRPVRQERAVQRPQARLWSSRARRDGTAGSIDRPDPCRLQEPVPGRSAAGEQDVLRIPSRAGPEDRDRGRTARLHLRADSRGDAAAGGRQTRLARVDRRDDRRRRVSIATAKGPALDPDAPRPAHTVSASAPTRLRRRTKRI